MKKLIFILFITLFLSIDVYAASSIKVNKIINNMPEYNDEEFKDTFTKYCNTFNEKTTLLYVDRMFDVLLKSGTDEDVYRFVTNCIQENNQNSNNKLFYDKMVENKYHKLISKYYNYLFVLPSYYYNEYTYYNIQLKLFYDKLNKEDVKPYINLITSDDYIITPSNYKKLSFLQNKIDEKDMKTISLKLEKDMVKYAKNQFNEQISLYMDEFEKSGMNDKYTLDFLNKNYITDIDYNLLLKLIKVYYYLNLKDEYKELADNIMKYISLKTDYDDTETIYIIPGNDDTGFNKNYLKDIDSVFAYLSLFSHIEIHHDEDANVRYAYSGSKPLKIKGVFTLSNMDNEDAAYPDEELNGYLPKTSFMSYDKSIQLNQISIRPKRFTYSSNIDSKILENSLFKEINFDAEIIIGRNSKIYLNRGPETNSINMYIDEVKINKIVSSQKYEDDDSYPVYIIIKQ